MIKPLIFSTILHLCGVSAIFSLTWVSSGILTSPDLSHKLVVCGQNFHGTNNFNPSIEVPCIVNFKNDITSSIMNMGCTGSPNGATYNPTGSQWIIRDTTSDSLNNNINIYLNAGVSINTPSPCYELALTNSGMITCVSNSPSNNVVQWAYIHVDTFPSSSSCYLNIIQNQFTYQSNLILVNTYNTVTCSSVFTSQVSNDLITNTSPYPITFSKSYSTTQSVTLSAITTLGIEKTISNGLSWGVQLPIDIAGFKAEVSWSMTPDLTKTISSNSYNTLNQTSTTLTNTVNIPNISPGATSNVIFNRNTTSCTTVSSMQLYNNFYQFGLAQYYSPFTITTTASLYQTQIQVT